MNLLPSDEAAVLGVADRWKFQYCKKGKWLYEGKQEIYEQLAALRPGATKADVARIIGNDSWIGEMCTECGKRDAVVMVGQEPDYESMTVYLCRPCVERLAALVTSVAQTPHKEQA